MEPSSRPIWKYIINGWQTESWINIWDTVGREIKEHPFIRVIKSTSRLSKSWRLEDTSGKSGERDAINATGLII